MYVVFCEARICSFRSITLPLQANLEFAGRLNGYKHVFRVPAKAGPHGIIFGNLVWLRV
jgi:hypothetical protein